MNMAEVIRAEAAHARGEFEKSLAAHADALGEIRDRAGLLQGQLEAVHSELAQAKLALEQAWASNSASERLAAEALRDQVTSLARVTRAEDLAFVRGEYEKLLAAQVEALAESGSTRIEAEEARATREKARDAALCEVAELQKRLGDNEHVLVAERSGREAAEGLARALEAELVEQMRNAGAQAEALAAARQRLEILEGSRYLRARRKILRLLGRRD